MMRAKDVMTKDLILAEVPSNRHDLLKIFSRYQVSGVPVVKKGTRKLVGLVTSKDLFRKFYESQTALIMNPDPITIGPEASLQRVVRVMTDNHIHRLLVVKAGTVQGIITPTDLLRFVIEKGSRRKVLEYVKRRCVPIYEETPLFIAWRILKVSNSYALPVLGRDGKLSGIITDRDFFGVGKISGSSRGAKGFAIQNEEDVWTWEGIRNIMKHYYEVSDMDLPKVPVREVMTPDPVTVMSKTSVTTAARKMYRHNFRVLPIVDTEDNLINDISDLEVLQVLLED